MQSRSVLRVILTLIAVLAPTMLVGQGSFEPAEVLTKGFRAEYGQAVAIKRRIVWTLRLVVAVG